MNHQHSRLTAITVAALSLALSSQAFAIIIPINAADPGAGPGDPRPLSNAAAAGFFGVHGINFENVPLGNFASMPIGLGVAATLTGTADNGGIRTTPTYFSGSNPTIHGYNTTTGGERFLGLVPLVDVGTARLTLNFFPAITSIGSFVTGLQQQSGDLFVTFNNGAPQTLQVTGHPDGGARFLGFRDISGAIFQMSFEFRSVADSVRDIIAFDDIRYTFVPEPTAIVLAATLIPFALITTRRRSVDGACAASLRNCRRAASRSLLPSDGRQGIPSADGAGNPSPGRYRQTIRRCQRRW